MAPWNRAGFFISSYEVPSVAPTTAALVNLRLTSWCLLPNRLNLVYGLK